jgi:Rrf2 family protein
MKITAQEEYGLRCLLQLARNASEPSPLTVRTVAEREGLSIAYAEKLLHALGRARLAESVRGVRGGYRMARAPDTVTIGEAMRALGGVLSPTELCERFTGKEDCCVHARDCSLRSVWSALSLIIGKLLDQVPISTLLQREKAVQGDTDALWCRLLGELSEKGIVETTGETT